MAAVFGRFVPSLPIGDFGAFCEAHGGKPFLISLLITMLNSALRDYRIPTFADVPRSEVYFADTYDTIGPMGAKSMGECAINPVAPAVANAIANATGARFTSLPLSPERIFDRLGPRP